MGKALISIGAVWLATIVVVSIVRKHTGFGGFGISIPSGASQKQAEAMMFAMFAFICLGWLIPLGAGIFMLRRR